jgi:fatty acid desaturase
MALPAEPYARIARARARLRAYRERAFRTCRTLAFVACLTLLVGALFLDAGLTAAAAFLFGTSAASLLMSTSEALFYVHSGRHIPKKAEDDLPSDRP